MSRPSSEVVCEECGIKFHKENRLINATVKRSGVHCCTRACSTKYVKRKALNKADPFNHYLINIRKRFKGDPSIIVTAQHLADVWESQYGKCALTGLPLHHSKQRTKKDISQASVDRIDDSKDYIEGNVQFTTLGANYMRNTFSIIDTKEFIQKIRELG